MPRYFFDYFDSGERGKTSDTEGTDLEDTDAALSARAALAIDRSLELWTKWISKRLFPRPRRKPREECC
jgi:hypothetical protein